MTIPEILLCLICFCAGALVGLYAVSLLDEIVKRREERAYKKLNRDLPYE